MIGIFVFQHGGDSHHGHSHGSPSNHGHESDHGHSHDNHHGHSHNSFEPKHAHPHDGGNKIFD